MSKEKPELKNGDQTYRVNSDNFGLDTSAILPDYEDTCENDDEIPF
ncbi:MAG: hypothetical protein E6356_10900 [Terrisporobacter othiniensis]|nr:hypothetical protein [Terrisporobacter petrolearius]MDU4861701.1 hypothetical protein [Terrisporobacter othiniensis]MDU6995354.1 hypothetical protein [Terrisporobacter othiniensis]